MAVKTAACVSIAVITWDSVETQTYGWVPPPIDDSTVPSHQPVQQEEHGVTDIVLLHINKGT
jgi:hypothetical protein